MDSRLLQPRQKNKVVSDALKYSDESSLKYYLKKLVTDIQDLSTANDGMIASFVPSEMPMKPTANDPLLLECFICRSSDEPLQDFHDVNVCAGCDLNSGTHRGTLTRDWVMSYFHFSKSEADKITCKKSTGGRYGSLINVYNVKTVVAAAQKNMALCTICSSRIRGSIRVEEIVVFKDSFIFEVHSMSS